MLPHPPWDPRLVKRTPLRAHDPDRLDDRMRCRSSRNVERRQRGDTALRWTAAGMLEAEQHCRQV
jgi:hypothetical protein